MPSNFILRFAVYLKILRLTNFVIAFASIYFAVLIANEDLAFQLNTFFAALSGAVIGGAGMVINDYFDFEIDKLNRPERPIPAGLISKNNALKYYIILNAIAFIMLYKTGVIVYVIALCSMVLIFFYSFKLKRLPLVGNLCVALMTGIAFIFGGAVGGNIQNLIIPAVFAFLINLAREIIKATEDLEGDKQFHLRTFPIVFGDKIALKLAFSILILLMFFTLLPYIFKIYSLTYFLIIVFGVNAVIIYSILSLQSDSSKSNLRRIGNLIKYDMAIGLLAIYLGIK
ncbi:MAG: hypothetical protein FJ213_04260 [Ignavibacteria bacterium]|nr:hypothetical protein [Ignavibacteria bacterium]